MFIYKVNAASQYIQVTNFFIYSGAYDCLIFKHYAKQNNELQECRR